MATVADKARKALAKLRQGYPLKSGRVVKKPPVGFFAAGKGKEVGERTKVSAADMAQVEERQRQEKGADIRRGGKKK